IINSLLALLTVIILVLAGGYFFVYNRYPEFKTTYLILFALIAIALMIFFRWMEEGWDKRVITRMAKDGKVALANIKHSERVMRMRDSAFTNFWLYEFVADLVTPELETLKDVKFWEKMNVETDKIPNGSVFVTYDPEKPTQIFVVPNVLISQLPELMPAVRKIEANASIRYLDTYYNKGMVIKSMKDSLTQQRQAVEEQKRKEG
ncbi:MAG: hypothetical protein AAGU23_07755, partial [Bacillota bacterium]